MSVLVRVGVFIYVLHFCMASGQLATHHTVISEEPKITQLTNLLSWSTILV
jgi:hypothetical protein